MHLLMTQIWFILQKTLIPEVLRYLQKCIVLKATGGALVPEKSYWYLIDFIWTGEKWRYVTKEDMPGDILINNIDDSGRDTLRRFEVDIAKETLGVFLAMDGNNMEETLHLRKKAVAFADCIRTGFLTREDATYALHRTIMKTLEYPIVATTMDKAQWDFIMAPILVVTLPCMGYVQSFPRDIVYISSLANPTSFPTQGVVTGDHTSFNHGRPNPRVLGATATGDRPTGPF
jgi:hypothetical protein